MNKLSDIAKQIDTAPEYEGDIDDESFLPRECPVIPLGTKKGTYYYMDALQQFRELKDKDHSRLAIQGLFGIHPEMLSQGRYARYTKKGDVEGWKPEEWARDLMASCAIKGVFDPFEKVRGAGAWLDNNGKLVLHCGNRILINDTWNNPGVFASYIYPAEAKRQNPADSLLSDTEADEILTLIKSWSWKKLDIDPYLLIGWIGAAMIGGAIKWRPLMWLTGDKGTGKSTLQDVLNMLFGNSLLSVSNTSPAGIWQKVGYSSLPVAVDEIEAEEDGRKAQAVIALARQACSGGVILRGSSEGIASEFKARNCYLFSSILIPPLKPQDRSRMAILELEAIRGNPLKINRQHMCEIGRKIFKTMISHFERFEHNFEMISVALRQAGMSSRGCDEFGTLVAACDVLMRPREMTENDCNWWVERMKPLMVRENYEMDGDNVACAQHLLTSLCDNYKDGKRRTLGDYIAEAARLENSRNTQPTDDDAREANKILVSYGLKVGIIDKNSPDKVLYVANNHQSLNKIYKETHWRDGVYRQSLLRFDGAQPINTIRFGGMTAKCIQLPLDKLLNVDSDMLLDIIK